MKNPLVDWICHVACTVFTAALIGWVAYTLYRIATWLIATLQRVAADAAAVLSTVPVPQMINYALMLLTVVILLLTIKELLELRK